MSNVMIGLLAETSLHPGCEQSTGVVDLPVAREGATGYPVLVGSSLKGALKDKAKKNLDEGIIKELFGAQENAGSAAVTDARLLLLPVRSLTGHYKWVTCPYLLERFLRDRQLIGLTDTFDIPRPEPEQVITAKDGSNDYLFLEEISFKVQPAEAAIAGIADTIAPLLLHQSAKSRLKEQLAIISDDEFSHFAKFGLQVNARNQLDQQTKRSENLWYEETLPTDTLLYALLIPRQGQEPVLNNLKVLFEQRPYLQVGGNETVGQGWCAVAWQGQEG